MKHTFIIFLIILNSCNTTKKAINDSEIPDSEITDSSSAAKIIFLNYKIKKDSKGIEEIKLINKIISKGSLKKNGQKETTDIIDGFVCTQLDKKLLPIDSVQISNPLIKTFEYFDPSGLMGKKTIELDSAEFTVRIQLKPNAKFVSLKKTNSNNILLKTQL